MHSKPICRYGRVSKDEQARDTEALERQLFQLANCASQWGPLNDDWLLVDIQSGRRDDRPEFQKLVKAIESRQIERVILTRIDRITRDLETNARLAKLFQKTGVRIYEMMLGRDLDFANPNDWEYFVRSGVEAERESRMLSIRTKAGIEYLKHRNRIVGGKVTWGYRRSPNNTPEIDPELFDLARTVVEVFLRERSPVALSRIMSLEHGITKTYQAWRRWLQSPIPRGHIGYGQNRSGADGAMWSYRDVRWNTHDAIISPSEAKEIDSILDDNRRIWGANRAKEIRPLSGLLECAVCGGAGQITGMNKESNSGPFIYCSNRRRNLGIGCGALPLDRKRKGLLYTNAEEAVIAALCDRASDIIHAVGIELEDQPEPEEDLKLRSQIEQIQRLIKEVGDSSGLLRQKIAELEGQSTTAKPPSTLEEDREALISFGDLKDPWRRMLSEKRRSAFKRFVRRVLFENDRVTQVDLNV